MTTANDTPHNTIDQAMQRLVKIAEQLNAGQTAKAEGKLDTLLTQHPTLAPAHLLLSQLKTQQNEVDSALHHAAEAYRLAPTANACHHYATVLIATHQLDLAEKVLLELTKNFQENISGWKKLRRLYAQKNSPEQELTTLLQLQTLTPLNHEELKRAYPLVKKLNTLLPIERHQALTELLLEMLDIDGVDFQDLCVPLNRYLIQQYLLIIPDLQLELSALLDDTLLIKALPKVIFTSPRVDELLTTLRKVILQATLQEQALNPALLKLTSALGLHNYLNEYIHGYDDDEQQMVTMVIELLEQQSSQPDWQPQQSHDWLLVIALYQQLLELPYSQRLLEHPLDSWPPALSEIARNTLFDPALELKEMLEIPKLTTIENEVSQAVQQHYEQNPYPRWLSSQASELDSLQTLIEAFIPGFIGTDTLQKPTTPILVSGCGTGRQPISYAQNFPQAPITAVDISRRSLAYARNKARELNVDNVDFYQADILQLPQTGKRFHFIACSGVLHHMQDPMQGWAALAQMLEPGGIMIIGLYSSLARRNITRERDKIAALKLQPTPDNIRNYRQAMLQSDTPSPIIQQCRDFHSLSECRDLLFHQHEQCFSWPQIGNCCDTLGLKFLGLFGSQDLTKHWQKKYPGLDLTKTSTLNTLEQLHPDSFSSMYQFICQKPLQTQPHPV